MDTLEPFWIHHCGPAVMKQGRRGATGFLFKLVAKQAVEFPQAYWLVTIKLQDTVCCSLCNNYYASTLSLKCLHV